MRWLEQGCWKNLADFGYPAIAFGDGICFAASDGERIVFWSPTSRHVVPVDERPVVLCKGPGTTVLVVGLRSSWILDSRSPTARYELASENTPLALEHSLYSFTRDSFWYVTAGPRPELVAFAQEMGPVVRLALDERWMQGPVVVYPHEDRLFCESAHGQVSAWVVKDSEGFYLEGTRYRGPLVGLIGKKRVVLTPNGLALCDENGNLSHNVPYPKSNPLLSPEVFQPVVKAIELSEDAVDEVLGEQAFVSAAQTPVPYIPWCEAREDGTLLAMHDDRLLRLWAIDST